MSNTTPRTYTSELRDQGAEETRARILNAAKTLFARKGIDGVTIAQIAAKAGVATPTVYAAFKSKEGLLRGLMDAALFGQRFQTAQRLLEGVTDSVELIALTAHVSRAIYESESADLGLLRGASSFSPALRKLEKEFERTRLEMQEARLRLLFDQARNKDGLSFDDAQRILWMYTSRDIYRMLVQERGWSADQYQRWLSETLVMALVKP